MSIAENAFSKGIDAHPLIVVEVALSGWLILLKMLSLV